MNLAPMQADIDRALAFSGRLFETGDWERTYTVTNDVVQVSWYSALIPAIVNLELHIFPCGYEEPDLNTFLTRMAGTSSLETIKAIST